MTTEQEVASEQEATPLDPALQVVADSAIEAHKEMMAAFNAIGKAKGTQSQVLQAATKEALVFDVEWPEDNFQDLDQLVTLFDLAVWLDEAKAFADAALQEQRDQIIKSRGGSVNLDDLQSKFKELAVQVNAVKTVATMPGMSALQPIMDALVIPDGRSVGNNSGSTKGVKTSHVVYGRTKNGVDKPTSNPNSLSRMRHYFHLKYDNAPDMDSFRNLIRKNNPDWKGDMDKFVIDTPDGPWWCKHTADD